MIVVSSFITEHMAPPRGLFPPSPCFRIGLDIAIHIATFVSLQIDTQQVLTAMCSDDMNECFFAFKSL